VPRRCAQIEQVGVSAGRRPEPAPAAVTAEVPAGGACSGAPGRTGAAGTGAGFGAERNRRGAGIGGGVRAGEGPAALATCRHRGRQFWIGIGSAPARRQCRHLGRQRRGDSHGSGSDTTAAWPGGCIGPGPVSCGIGAAPATVLDHSLCHLAPTAFGAQKCWPPVLINGSLREKETTNLAQGSESSSKGASKVYRNRKSPVLLGKKGPLDVVMGEIDR
jgi:hypothetical protein